MAIIRRVNSRKNKPNENKSKVTVTIGEDSSNSVKSVTIYIPLTQGQPAPDPENITLSFEKMEGEDRLFSYDQLNFSSDPTDFTYEMTATMKNGSGGTIGSPLTEEVQIEAAVLA
jgi:hypothetical protein